MAKGPMISDTAIKVIVYAVGAYLLFKFISDSITSVEDKISSGVQSASNSVTGAIRGAFDGVSAGITGGFATVGQGITNSINLIGSGITSGVTNIGQSISHGYDMIGDGVNEGIKDLTTLPGVFAESVQNNLAPINTGIQYMGGILGGGLFSLWNSGTSTSAGTRTDGITDNAYNLMDDYSMSDNPNWANEDTLP